MKILILLLCLVGYTALAQDEVSIENKTYLPTIKTVQICDSSFQLSDPIILLGSKQQLKLSFDDLCSEIKNFSYTLVHCNSNWMPSHLSPLDYMNGVPTDNINDHEFAVNTRQPYIHYSLQFPSESMRLTKSGNYILKVYQDNNPEKLVLTRRFYVFEQKVLISASVKPTTVIIDRNYKQQIDLSITTNGLEINNPYDDVKVVIKQNGREDNAIQSLKPHYVRENTLMYDYDNGENVFTGGNEFRNFDIKTLHTPTEHVQKIIPDSNLYHVLLLPDEKRPFKRYTKIDDINGRYLIKDQDAASSETESDYVFVHFFLPSSEFFQEGDIYLMGALVDWQLNEQNKMTFNVNRHGYELTLLLKQGYYNYQYLLLPKGKKVADETFIEGMHFETENDYTILVYLFNSSEDYDSLISVKHLNSSATN